MLEALHEDFEGSGFSFKALLVDLVSSEAFRYVGRLDTEADQQEEAGE